LLVVPRGDVRRRLAQRIGGQVKINKTGGPECDT
jgi:hypothetical protein